MTWPASDHRVTAADWHGGQTSVLYAYASSGHIVADPWRWYVEISTALEHEADEAECAKLLALADHVAKTGGTEYVTYHHGRAEPRGAEDGWDWHDFRSRLPAQIDS